MELTDYIRILRKRWMLIVILALAGLAGSASVSILTTPQFQASTLLYVSVQSASGQVQDLASGNTFAQQQVKSYTEAVPTALVLQPVVDRLGLAYTAPELAKHVTATATLSTVNIQITVTDPSAQRAADIANAIGTTLPTVVSQITAPTAAGAVSPVRVSVLDPAVVPAKPVSPNTNLNLALGALIGLALGLGLAVLIEVLDTRVRTERDVRAVTDAAIIGGIVFDKDSSKRPLIVQAEPTSPRAEAFRSLRTNLQFLDVEGGARSFVLTSSVESEGKSTTAANLAITLADSGARVAVVDADLRRPKLADYLGIEGAVGLSDVLIGRAQLADVLQPWGNGYLTVLPAGTIPPNPSELLGSSTMESLIRLLESEFDAVIFDAPPLLPVTDAAILAAQTRGALLVTASGRTRRGELQAATEVLAHVDARLSGVIITMLPTKGPDSYHYGRYGYGYKDTKSDRTPPMPSGVELKLGNAGS